MDQSFNMDNMQQIMQLQQMQEQLEDLSKQLEEIQEKQETIAITVNALDELRITENGTEILSPIADGIFVKTKLNDSSVAIVNIGNGITVEKPIADVIEMVKGHDVKMMHQSKLIETEMQTISNTILETITKLEMEESNARVN
ncbi:prefoldin subunit alpha [archaeon]|jgi:prefoldin alpha subunit|nr:prefoldin subunit alpha [archaeon]MBT6762683.1 prefoldin subunit alpha [archaeon]